MPSISVAAAAAQEICCEGTRAAAASQVSSTLLDMVSNQSVLHGCSRLKVEKGHFCALQKGSGDSPPRCQRNHKRNQRRDRILHTCPRAEIWESSPHFGLIFLLCDTGNLEKEGKEPLEEVHTSSGDGTPKLPKLQIYVPCRGRMCFESTRQGVGSGRRSNKHPSCPPRKLKHLPPDLETTTQGAACTWAEDMSSSQTLSQQHPFLLGSLRPLH